MFAKYSLHACWGYAWHSHDVAKTRTMTSATEQSCVNNAVVLKHKEGKGSTAWVMSTVCAYTAFIIQTCGGYLTGNKRGT